MESQFSFRDDRDYIHNADLMAFVLRRFGTQALDKIVIDFLKPTSTVVDMVLRDHNVDTATDDAVFTVKLMRGHVLQVYSALPQASQPIVERVVSDNSAVSATYTPQTMEVTSPARTASDFFLDLNNCMKKHWKDYNHQNRALMMRRMSLRLPFQVPTGVPLSGKYRKLKLGAQAWDFNAATLPGFEFSVVGLYQKSSHGPT